jgi:hypothetical protein
MFYILLANQKFMSFLKLATLCATVALGVVLMAGAVKADEYGDFDSTGHYRYQNLPGNPSPGHDGYNSYQRQQEQMDRYRQQSLEAERQRSTEPAPSLGYRPPSVTILPDGKSMACYGPTKGNPLTTCF